MSDEKNCIKIRGFEEKDADEVQNLIVRNFLEVNSKDYGTVAMEKLAKVYDAGKILNIASFAHMYVFEWKQKIVGVGSISSFWGSFGYEYKNGVKVLDEEHHYRLEKFKEAGQ